MPPHRVSTSDYTEDARLGLASAVTRARTAAGWPRRKDLAAEAAVSLRSIAKLESGETNLGWRVLEAVGRALPGWNEDTPRDILEGGTPPAISDRQDPPVAPVPTTDVELELVTRLLRRGWSPEQIDKALDALPTVETDRNSRPETDQQRSGVFLDHPSETGTE